MKNPAYYLTGFYRIPEFDEYTGETIAGNEKSFKCYAETRKKLIAVKNNTGNVYGEILNEAVESEYYVETDDTNLTKDVEISVLDSSFKKILELSKITTPVAKKTVLEIII